MMVTGASLFINNFSDSALLSLLGIYRLLRLK